MTRSGRRRRLVSEPTTVSTSTTRRVKTNSGNGTKYQMVLVRPSPITRVVKNSSPKNVAVTTIVQTIPTSTIMSDKGQKIGNNMSLRSLDSGISLGGYVYESTESASSRSSTSDSKMSTPNGSKRSSPTTTKFRAIPINLLQTQQRGECSREQQLFISEESNSFNASEVSICFFSLIV